jgi:hypothetical protein
LSRITVTIPRNTLDFDGLTDDLPPSPVNDIPDELNLSSFLGSETSARQSQLSGFRVVAHDLGEALQCAYVCC